MFQFVFSERYLFIESLSITFQGVLIWQYYNRSILMQMTLMGWCVILLAKECAQYWLTT